jgi:hypothetical protein
MKSAAIRSSGRHIIGTYYISIMCLLCARSRVFLLQTHTRNPHHHWTLRPAVKPLAANAVAVLASLSRDTLTGGRSWFVCVPDRTCTTQDKDCFSAEWCYNNFSHVKIARSPTQNIPTSGTWTNFTTAAFSFKHCMYRLTACIRNMGAGRATVSQDLPPTPWHLWKTPPFRNVTRQSSRRTVE